MAGRIPLFWIASYPKSGSTWVRALCAVLLHGPERGIAELGRLVPDIHDTSDLRGLLQARPAFIKAHAIRARLLKEWDANVKLRELFDFSGYVFVTRNPEDVVVSLYDFFILNHPGVAEVDDRALFDDFVEAFVRTGGKLEIAGFYPVGLLEHFESYRDVDDLLTVRYEDLHAAPEHTVRRMADRCGIVAGGERIGAAIAACSFRALRAEEERRIAEGDDAGEFYRPWRKDGYRAGRRFFSRGGVGRGADKLTRAQRVRMREAFLPVYESLYPELLAEDAGASAQP